MIKLMPLVTLLMVGCVNVLPQPGPAPKRVMLDPVLSTGTLTHTNALASKQALAIARPSSSQSLDSVRVRVITRDQGVQLIDALADVEWHEPLPAMVQKALLHGFMKANKYTAVGDQESCFSAEVLLETEIQAFDVVFDKGTDQVIISLNSKLIDLSTRKVQQQQIFTATVPVKTRTVTGVMTALNQAFTTVVEQLVNAF
jgi:ABC-type uncharacterized transport system auxiliary subunit